VLRILVVVLAKQCVIAFERARVVGIATAPCNYAWRKACVQKLRTSRSQGSAGGLVQAGQNETAHFAEIAAGRGGTSHNVIALIAGSVATRLAWPRCVCSRLQDNAAVVCSSLNVKHVLADLYSSLDCTAALALPQQKPCPACLAVEDNAAVACMPPSG
jgi:hypothetical protein